MAKTSNKLLDDERQGRSEHTRENIASGDPVGEPTASQRRLWEERAASFREHADPGERERREAAPPTRLRATREQTGPGRDASPPR